MNDTSLKAKIRNIAVEKNVTAQSVLQCYLMQRFLYRLASSAYKDKFVIKGGMLISSMVGIDQRSTMDIDTCIRNLPLSENAIRTAFEKICDVNVNDGLEFNFNRITPIRDDDEYGGYRISYTASYGKIKAPMSMDVSTGDIITPGAEKHIFYDMLDESISYELWSYTIETVLAEKIETILSRSIENTRPRDFYDVYMLSAMTYDRKVLKQAFTSTAKHRKTFEKITNCREILDAIAADSVMKNRWDIYSKKTSYAGGISFEETIQVLKRLTDDLH